jgi:hypothetical protein
VTNSATFTTPDAGEEDLGDLLLEVLPPDGSTMGNNKRAWNSPSRIGLVILLSIFSNPAYGSDFLQCEAIRRREKELMRIYFELQIDAQESIKRRILDAKCGIVENTTTLADLQAIGDCKRSISPINYERIVEYRAFDNEFLSPIREKLKRLDSESRKNMCI